MQDPRVSAMFGRDRAAAILAVVIVWLVYAFTFWTMRQAFADSHVTALMVVLGICVVLLNTAAIVAMIRHYSEDRAAIYGMDLYYLDRLRALRRNRGA
ncbi:hypothetical protein MMB17_17365 [Methylobacterium organophilum]|uniref:hypothetical protein n=1 Tax=Methylobacterium organophilum TaxID=410 RepID=UPI001F1441A6|nr:hypothetical protein [Methylobacterium organophilum]UMY16459.1 hypothetical protein MMB17_17365 [Methylobacterium organophilum]